MGDLPADSRKVHNRRWHIQGPRYGEHQTAAPGQSPASAADGLGMRQKYMPWASGTCTPAAQGMSTHCGMIS
jgi:hypothetical protein